MPGRAVIAGGGLAGLACAKQLVDAGWGVTVVEGQPFLGGRASTFRDGDGDWVEQGLHLFLGVYSEFKALLRGIGQDPDRVLFWMDEVRLQDPEGRAQATYGINPLTSPLKTLLGALGNNDYLGPLDKLALLPLVAPGPLPLSALQAQYDGMTVADWWRQTGADPRVMERFIRPFCRAIQFSDAEQFSAYNFLAWIHHIAYDLPHSLLGGYRGARNALIFDPLQAYLEARGATVRTGVKVRSLELQEGRAAGLLLEDGGRLEADAYVAAVPVWHLPPLLPAPLRAQPFFHALETLPTAPAISVQLWFDREVVQTQDFTLVAHSVTPVWQEQSRNAYPTAEGHRISVIVSPADGLLGETDEALVRTVVDTLGRMEPGIAQARVRKSVVLRHEKHLVRPLPGAMSRRPLQTTPVPNLFLAGDWTQQPFFGSQEGAVRGGNLCAQALLQAEGEGRLRP
jgi:uncharacterized protein with NAD-binding domain and iron-sulfur cluster